MRRRHRRNDAGVALVALVPWWVWLLLAAVSFAVFHWMATLPRTASGPEAMGRALWIGLGYAGRLLAPAVFLLAAVFSLMSHRRRAPDTQISTWRDSNSSPVETRAEPILDDAVFAAWMEAPSTPERAVPDTSRWSLELLRALEWKRFEQLCAVYFRTLKFRVEEVGLGPDDGIDLRLYVGSERRPGVLVQCKAWNSVKVGVKELRELFGVMASEMVGEGIFVTTSTFTREAADFARGKNIALIDGEDLLRKLLALPADDQVHILNLSTAGDFMTPTCASCGIKMVRRTAQATGQAFWGCPKFPQCRTTIALRNSQRLNVQRGN